MELKTNGSSDNGLDILEALYYLYKKKIIILTVTFISLVLALVIYQNLPNKYVGSLYVEELSTIQNPFNDIVNSQQLKKTFFHILIERTEFTDDEIAHLHNILKSNLNKDSEEFLNYIHNSYSTNENLIIAKSDNIEFIKEVILLKLIDANNKAKKIVSETLDILSNKNSVVGNKFSSQDQIIDLVLGIEKKFDNENISVDFISSDPEALTNLISELLVETYSNRYYESIRFLEYAKAETYFSNDEFNLVNYSIDKLQIENAKYSFVYLIIIFLFLGLLTSSTFILMQRELKNRNFS